MIDEAEIFVILSKFFAKMASSVQKGNQDENLINEVKANRILFDKAFGGYRNSLKKGNTWVAVANRLGRPVEQVQKHWKSLRDRFVKEYRSQQFAARSGAGACEPSDWIHYEELTFLIGHVKLRNTKGNYAQPNEAEAVEILEEEAEPAPNELSFEQQEETQAVEQDIDAGTSSPRLAGDEQAEPKRKRKRMANTETDAKVGNILNKVYTELDKIGNRPQKRHAAFGALLIDRMEMLPNDIAMGLELEFLSRVNLMLQEMDQGFTV